jgi:hypothetical protein
MNAMGVATASNASSSAAAEKAAAPTPATPLKPGGKFANSFHSAQGAMASTMAVKMQICARRGSTLWQRWWM